MSPQGASITRPAHACLEAQPRDDAVEQFIDDTIENTAGREAILRLGLHVLGESSQGLRANVQGDQGERNDESSADCELQTIPSLKLNDAILLLSAFVLFTPAGANRLRATVKMEIANLRYPRSEVRAARSDYCFGGLLTGEKS